ncbi:MAG TPA: hypothetical protein ENI88_03875 [Desulfobulbus sp.]|nr:hypothetical protein [Desulfobulbus sp.]
MPRIRSGKRACETPGKRACETPGKRACETPGKRACETPIACLIGRRWGAGERLLLNIVKNVHRVRSFRE